MPGFRCVVKGCESYYRNNKQSEKTMLEMYSFPKKSEVRELWLKACGDKNNNVKSRRKHFTDDDCRLLDILLNSPIEQRRLKPTAIPSEKQEVLAAIARESRIYQRNRKKIVESAITDYNMSISNKENIPEAN